MGSYTFGITGESGSSSASTGTQTPLTYGANYQLNLQRYNATIAGYQAQAHQQALAAKQITGQYASGYGAQQNLLQSQWQSAIPNAQQQMISKGLGSSTVLSGMQNQALQQQSMAENQLAGQYAQGLAGIEAQNQGAYQNVLGAYNQFMASQTAPVGQAVQTTQTGGQGGYQLGLTPNDSGLNSQGGMALGSPIGAAGSAPMGATPSIGAMQGAVGGYSGVGTGYGNGTAQYPSDDSGSYYDDSGSYDSGSYDDSGS